jgi:thymidylate synthase ThyX
MGSAEVFTEDERATLSSRFTNVDEKVFGLRLPQEVAGALFSRYSRTAKSLRRVYLDEFAGAAPPETEAETGDAVTKARAFYDRVLVGYGDDSVAQLGGAHVACERISNVAAKLLEDARIGAAFLEKSTRYVRFDEKGLDGEWLFYKEPRILASRFADEYLGLMQRLFETYARQLDPMVAHIERSLPIEQIEVRHPKTGEPVSPEEVRRSPELLKAAERAYRQTVRAHACDVMRAYLPAATLTNLGVYATGQAFEHLIDKLASHELAEARELAGSLRRELDALIPSFVKRSGRSAYLVALEARARELAARVAGAAAGGDAKPAAPPSRAVTLLDHDPDAEERVLAAVLYPHGTEPLETLRARVRALPPEERARLAEELASLRRNRRDKPGRALEAVDYTFDLVGNLGIYRDLHRHRILSQERQPFSTAHGYDVPPEIEEIGFAPELKECMDRAAGLHDAITREMPLEAQYVVPFAYRVRWYVRLNLREAVHLCELRSMPQGHPDYRLVVQEMWREIERVHPSLAVFGRFMNRDTYRLGRLQSELRTEWKRSLAAG